MGGPSASFLFQTPRGGVILRRGLASDGAEKKNGFYNTRSQRVGRNDGELEMPTLQSPKPRCFCLARCHEKLGEKKKNAIRKSKDTYLRGV